MMVREIKGKEPVAAAYGRDTKIIHDTEQEIQKT
jgi:hypothetical protein